MSPRKMRAVANMVRGEQVDAALATLSVMPKKAAKIIAKALVSASANAVDKSGGDLDTDTLIVHRIMVDGAGIVKRWMPRSQGRANRVNHRVSHLTVVVASEDGK